MHVAALTHDALRPLPPDRMGSGLLLAFAVHALLLAALALGVHWRNAEPAGVEAELWAAVPQVAAPRAVAPEPAPTPEPPKPAVQTPPPPPVQREADIAIEKAKKLQEQQKAREEEEKKIQQEKLKKTEEARKEAEQKRQDKLMADLRAQEMARINNALQGTGGPTSTGSAARSAGPSASYAGRIKARIKPNIVYTDAIVGDPAADVEVKVAPDGTIIGRRLIKSSGVKEWDEAVLRAIDRTEVLPRDVDGRVPPTIEILFRARDL